MRESLRCVIIEDEINAQELLQDIVSEYCTDVEVVGFASSNAEALSIIESNSLDFAFLDIELEDGPSFQLLDQIPTRDFSIIFTTAYDQYAIKAFKHEALDYILKPYTPSEVVRAIQRVRYQNRLLENSQLVTNNVVSSSKQISLPTLDGVDLVFQEDIIFCHAEGSYTLVCTSDGQHIVSRNLSNIEADLDPEVFVRIHASYLINMNAVKKYFKADGGSVLLKDGTVIPLARSRRSDFLDRLP